MIDPQIDGGAVVHADLQPPAKVVIAAIEPACHRKIAAQRGVRSFIAQGQAGAGLFAAELAIGGTVDLGQSRRGTGWRIAVEMAIHGLPLQAGLGAEFVFKAKHRGAFIARPVTAGRCVIQQREFAKGPHRPRNPDQIAAQHVHVGHDIFRAARHQRQNGRARRAVICRQAGIQPLPRIA